MSAQNTHEAVFLMGIEYADNRAFDRLPEIAARLGVKPTRGDDPDKPVSTYLVTKHGDFDLFAVIAALLDRLDGKPAKPGLLAEKIGKSLNAEDTDLVASEFTRLLGAPFLVRTTLFDYSREIGIAAFRLDRPSYYDFRLKPPVAMGDLERWAKEIREALT